MSIHYCKWSDRRVVTRRWQLTDQAYLDRNLEKPFFNKIVKLHPFCILRHLVVSFVSFICI